LTGQIFNKYRLNANKIDEMHFFGNKKGKNPTFYVYKIVYKIRTRQLKRNLLKNSPFFHLNIS